MLKSTPAWKKCTSAAPVVAVVTIMSYAEEVEKLSILHN